MTANDALERLRMALGPDGLRLNEPMSQHTTFRVGGPADLFLMPSSPEEAAQAVRICREAGIPVLPLGNGSNLLVRDGGIRGAVLHLGPRLSAIFAEGTILAAQAGAMLSRCAAEALAQGLVGMEFASGIPGSAGGAATMNAGAYGGEMKDIVRSVRAVTAAGELIEIDNADMHYAYRHSRALDEGMVLVEVALQLREGDREQSRALIDEYTDRRREKQPLEWPSAGSFFKRPPGHFAGKLISDAGLRGFRVGGAQISEKHAGFVINAGGATARDVLMLAAQVRARVSELYDVELETEVRMVGED